MKEEYILPKGFLSSGIKGGIKKSKKFDTGLILSLNPCECVAFYTKNKLKSAHILYDKKVMNNEIFAIFANSGNANALNGKQGLIDLIKIIKAIAKNLKIKSSSIMAASTGKIALKMPVKNIIKNIPLLIKNLSKNDKNFPKAILTTDLKTKVVNEKIIIDGKQCTITGVAKGSGMISPNMATMLAFVLTDININKNLLKKAAFDCVKSSFNKITVDGDMSPNDTVIFLSNKMAGNKCIDKLDKNYDKFKKALFEICYKLAEKIVEDGEGVTKVVKIVIENAKTHKQAENISRQIANSLLVKTAFFGESLNPGRIISAAGATLENIDIGKIELKFNNVLIIKNGKLVAKNTKKAEKILKSKKITLTLNLKNGKISETLLTTDLSYNYVKINAAYS
jgi:glutamate N-acetyltransferase/amino-acid N-acetyltransferase